MRTNRALFSILATVLLLPAIGRAEADRPQASAASRDMNAVSAEPWIQSGLPPTTRTKLSEAFSVALGRLRESPECRLLFEDLGADGTDALATTLYYGTSVREQQRYCRGTSAFTSVGGRVTRICRNFSRLPVKRAAVVLIHEALHQAGMSEKPLDPEALDSAQINDLVSERCAL